MKNKVTGIILLAGNSVRYGKGFNKNLDLLNNKYIFLYSLEVFNQCNFIDDIILVIKKSDKDKILKILKDIHLSKEIKLVIGGSTRQESVYNALMNTNANIVVIHDGARPLIKSRYIEEGINAMDNYIGAITAVPVKDTIKIANDNQEIVASTNRERTYIGQTPQVFKKNILLDLHQKYKNDNSITDDAMLLEKENYKIKIIIGDYTNIKITNREDLLIAQNFMEKNM